jgi:hypothetical protein
MPTVGFFTRTYWEFSDTVVPPPPSTAAGGYPAWQAGVITPSLLGMIGAWIDTHWDLAKWHWRLAKRIHGLSKESRAVLVRTLDTLESPLYPKAQAAVRKTATTLGFQQDPVRAKVIAYMKSETGRVENIYRHLHARKGFEETAGSTLSNPTKNLFTELAYQGFTISQK